jgi:hypothetical protein
MKEPSVADAERCMSMRIRSKQGYPDMSKEARKFIERIHKGYPEWYKSTEREVFYRSAPFGAQLPPLEKEE